MPKYKMVEQKEYVESSFHAYAIGEMRESREQMNRLTMSEEEKTSWLSLMWVVYLDRLEYAEYDIQPVLRAFESMIMAIDERILQLRRVQPQLAGLAGRLNRLNIRQLELMNENSKDNYSELFELGKMMFDRLYWIKCVLLKAAVDARDVKDSVAFIFEAMHGMADHFDYLALRHFYSTFTAGEYKCIAALCMGGSFIRAAAGCLLYHLADKDDPIGEAVRHSAFDREYDIETLCSFGCRFDFSEFDDDTNTLLPEVVDILFPDA